MHQDINRSPNPPNIYYTVPPGAEQNYIFQQTSQNSPVSSRPSHLKSTLLNCCKSWTNIGVKKNQEVLLYGKNI